MGVAGEVGGEQGVGDDNDDNNDDNDDTEETYVALHLLFDGDEGGEGALASSSPILGDDMMNPDLEGRVGGEGEEWGDERRAVRRLLFLGEGDEGALACSSPESLGDDVES